MRIKYKLLFLGLVLNLLIVPFFCRADFWDEWIDNQTQIINEVKVETNTGGNVIEGESNQIIEGEEKASVKTQTIVNDQEIEPINIETDSGSIEVTREIEVNSEGEVNVDTKIETGFESEPNSDTISYENPKSPIKKFWLNTLKGFKSFFSKIFSIFKR